MKRYTYPKFRWRAKTRMENGETRTAIYTDTHACRVWHNAAKVHGVIEVISITKIKPVPNTNTTNP